MLCSVNGIRNLSCYVLGIDLYLLVMLALVDGTCQLCWQHFSGLGATNLGFGFFVICNKFDPHS